LPDVLPVKDPSRPKQIPFIDSINNSNGIYLLLGLLTLIYLFVFKDYIFFLISDSIPTTSITPLLSIMPGISERMASPHGHFLMAWAQIFSQVG